MEYVLFSVEKLKKEKYYAEHIFIECYALPPSHFACLILCEFLFTHATPNVIFSFTQADFNLKSFEKCYLANINHHIRRRNHVFVNRFENGALRHVWKIEPMAGVWERQQSKIGYQAVKTKCPGFNCLTVPWSGANFIWPWKMKWKWHHDECDGTRQWLQKRSN